jgi:predicted XRE-type DNA-binding protein
LNRQEVDKFIKENQQISETAVAEKLNVGVSSVSEIVAGLGHKKKGECLVRAMPLYT